MKRRVFTILSALSLVLCVATCWMWIRSYSRDDTFEWRDRGLTPASLGDGWYRYIWGRSAWGLFQLQWYRQSYTGEATSFLLVDPCAEPRRALISNPVSTHQWPTGTFYGFSYARTHDEHSTLIAASAPEAGVVAFTCIMLSTTVVPVCRYRRRIKHGVCHQCGYDLRATPERCPECGTEAKTADA